MLKLLLVFVIGGVIGGYVAYKTTTAVTGAMLDFFFDEVNQIIDIDEIFEKSLDKFCSMDKKEKRNIILKEAFPFLYRNEQREDSK